MKTFFGTNTILLAFHIYVAFDTKGNACRVYSDTASIVLNALSTGGKPA